MRYEIIRYFGHKSKNMHINGHRQTSMRMPALSKHTYTNCSSLLYVCHHYCSIPKHTYSNCPCFLLDAAGKTSSYFHWVTSGVCLRGAHQTRAPAFCLAINYQLESWSMRSVNVINAPE